MASRAKVRRESKARAAARRALTPTKKLAARDKAQKERTVKAARAASDKGRPSNPTDPAGRLARRAVKEDEAKKLDEKLDRQSRVQAKRTQRVGERRVKAAGRAGKVGAGIAAAGALVGALSKDDKPKAKAKPVKRGPSMKEAGANIRKSKEAFERRRRSNRQAESAMRSVQKSRALGEAAARDPKATKPPKPQTPPTTSVKPPKADRTKVTSGATKPTPPKATTTPKVSSPPKVTKRPTVTGKGGRNVTREGPMGKRTLANVTKEQLTDTGMSLRQYLNYMDKNDGKRPPKKKDTVRRTGSSKPMSQRKFAGGGMASKMSAKGGARGGKKMMMPGGMKAGGSASKFPDLTGDGRVTQKDILKGRGVPGFSKGDLVINMVKELSKLGRRAFEKEYGKTALNKAIKETNKASGLTPTKAKKTPTQKKLAEADRRAEETKYTRQTPAAKKQRQVRASEKRMERMKNGGMAKKGYAKGGMAKKGYSKGGAVSRKPRGVGAALRGYGKALK